MNDRRSFFWKLAGLLAGVSFLSPTEEGRAEPATDRIGELLPTRPLGNTGEQIPMLGLGGWHIGRMEESEAERTIDTAIHGGIRFFDTAQDYQDGESERRYGKYLVPKYRDDVFLMTKTLSYDAETARDHLEGSLQRLKTDYLDLWQLHSLKSQKDAEQRLDDGLLEVMEEAKSSGKVRYIGFTGHRMWEAHRTILERTDLFDTCQMPVNVLDPGYKSFISNILPMLVEREMGVLAMKTLSNGRFFEQREGGRVIPELLSVKDALYFVWSLPVSVLITGPDDHQQLQEKIKLAKNFRPFSENRRQRLIAKVSHLMGNEREYYKP